MFETSKSELPQQYKTQTAKPRHMETTKPSNQILSASLHFIGHTLTSF